MVADEGAVTTAMPLASTCEGRAPVGREGGPAGAS
jgi:hypothetical protein